MSRVTGCDGYTRYQAGAMPIETLANWPALWRLGVDLGTTRLLPVDTPGSRMEWWLLERDRPTERTRRGHLPFVGGWHG